MNLLSSCTARKYGLEQLQSDDLREGIKTPIREALRDVHVSSRAARDPRASQEKIRGNENDVGKTSGRLGLDGLMSDMVGEQGSRSRCAADSLPELSEAAERELREESRAERLPRHSSG